MNYEKLLNIKENIENMSKYHQKEILEILKNFKNVILNENNNGIFVNLSNLDIDVINELEKHIVYVNTQQEYINIAEVEKKSIEENFFNENSEKNYKFDNMKSEKTNDSGKKNITTMKIYESI